MHKILQERLCILDEESWNSHCGEAIQSFFFLAFFSPVFSLSLPMFVSLGSLCCAYKLSVKSDFTVPVEALFKSLHFCTFQCLYLDWCVFLGDALSVFRGLLNQMQTPKKKNQGSMYLCQPRNGTLCFCRVANKRSH